MSKDRKKSLGEALVVAILVCLVFGYNIYSIAETHWPRGSNVPSKSKSPL